MGMHPLPTSFPELKQIADQLFIVHDHMQINGRYRDVAVSCGGADFTRRSVIMPSFAALYGLRVWWSPEPMGQT